MTLLSILDYGIRDEGQTSEEALAQTVEPVSYTHLTLPTNREV